MRAAAALWWPWPWATRQPASTDDRPRAATRSEASARARAHVRGARAQWARESRGEEGSRQAVPRTRESRACFTDPRAARAPAWTPAKW
eukprot:2709574-Pyramimonas_sp.AAC.1